MFTVLSLFFVPAGMQAQPLVGVRSLALSPDGSQLAFTYRGDVWVTGSGGGKATPVTTNVEMDDGALWSPDGKWIAFTSNRNGNNDIYITAAEGGETRRLTWHSGAEVPSGFTPDGKWILFRGTRDDSHNGAYAVNVETGQTRQYFLDMMNMGSPSMSPDGKELLYTRFGFPIVRPRYEGSNASQLWRYDIASGKRASIRNTGFQHLWPTFSGDGKSVYCVTVTEKTPSSHNIDETPGVFTDSIEKTPNVYRFGLDGKGQRLTDFKGFAGTRFLTVNGGKIAFERSGHAYVMAPGGKPEKITITASLDDKAQTEERLVITNGADDLSLSPKGDRMAFSVRGEIWVVPVKKGKGPNADDALQLTDYPGTDEQPLWSPDGKSVFFVSDRDGAERIYRLDVDSKKVNPFVRDDFDQSNLQITPDGKSLIYEMRGPARGLYVIAIEGGTPKKILDRPAGGGYDVSPDGRYLAYAKQLLNSGFNPWENATNIWVKDLTSGEERAITQLNVRHSSPEWSADGKYLYFRTMRDNDSIYMFPLTREIARTTELELKYEKPTGPVKVEIDFTDPETRLRRLVNAPGGGSGIFSDPTTGDVFYLTAGDVWKVSYAGEEARAITSGGGISSFAVSDDKNSLYFRKSAAAPTSAPTDPGPRGRRAEATEAGPVMTVLNLRSPQFPSTPVTFRADWTRDVKAERAAAFQQMWRVYNAQFYDHAMHRRNWVAIREEYRPLLDGVSHRNEMASVLGMMVGELESSHSEVSPGPGNPSGQTSAHLGFTIDYSHAGPGLKIKSVPERSPGSYAKTKLSPGEYVMAINGQDVRPDESLYRILADQSGRELTLSVNSTASATGARSVKYRALSGGEWSQLIYRNRIETRRKYVEAQSGGKLTYLHIAGMGGGNLDTFNLEAWQYIQGKQGVIIDVRNNGGGNIADILLDLLERKPQMKYLPRDDAMVTGPGTAWDKPTVVMHAETSLSNAEMFPAAMKDRGLAKLVGMPTPGYVIYTSGSRLVDGTSIRIPGTGVYRIDGTPTENMGQQPDFKVDITPDEYFAGKDVQLDKAIEVLMKQVK